MGTYSFSVGPTVVAGAGSLSAIGEWANRLGGTKAMIVTAPQLVDAGLADRIRAELPGATVFAGVSGEPTAEQLDRTVAALHEAGADMIVALGGGSVLDTAKLAAMLAANGGEIADYAADWSRISKPGVPLIVLPTTVGTGSELTPAAVVQDPAADNKVVVVSPLMFAGAAILDPTLLAELPSAVVVSTGCDALTQGIEGVFSAWANPFTDAFHLQGLRLIHRALPAAAADSADSAAIGAMQEAAAMIGAAMASGLGAAHAVANVLGGRYAIPHGVACGTMLLPVLRFNAAAVPAPARPVAAALGVNTEDLGDEAAVEAMLGAVEGLLAAVGAGWRLRDFGVAEDDLEVVAAAATAHQDMPPNPVEMSVADVVAVLREAW